MIPRQKLNLRRAILATGNGDGLPIGDPVGEPSQVSILSVKVMCEDPSELEQCVHDSKECSESECCDSN